MLLPRFSTLALTFVSSTLLIGLLGCEDFHSFWNKRTLEEDVKAMNDPIFADERRSGIAGIQRRPELTEEVYRERFRQMSHVETEEAGSIRAQAVRALNQSRDPKAKSIFLLALNDKEPNVRLEAVKALRHAPNDQAIPRLIEIAKSVDGPRDIRIWATVALGRYPRLDVARTLIALLNTQDFAVAYEARASLHRLTGKDFHYEEILWLRYFTSTTQPFLPLPTTRAASKN